jgi:hypothetical protein
VPALNTVRPERRPAGPKSKGIQGFRRCSLREGSLSRVWRRAQSSTHCPILLRWASLGRLCPSGHCASSPRRVLRRLRA